MNLIFRPAPSASALYAAACRLLDRPLVEPTAAATLAEPVRSLQVALHRASLTPEALLLHGLPRAAENVPPAALAEHLLAKARGRSAAGDYVPPLTQALRGVFRAGEQIWPHLAEELPLRVGPVREQWEAYGPGLLSQLVRLLEPGIVVEQAAVLLVQPIRGGGGLAQALYNAVTLEAVLANPVAALPEVLRLAFLLGQLNLELPMLSEGLPPGQLPVVGALALVPAVLQAAQELEIVRDPAEQLPAALAAWLPDLADRAAVARTLGLWWETYLSGKPGFRVALVALGEMLRAPAAAE